MVTEESTVLLVTTYLAEDLTLPFTYRAYPR